MKIDKEVSFNSVSADRKKGHIYRGDEGSRTVRSYGRSGFFVRCKEGAKRLSPFRALAQKV